MLTCLEAVYKLGAVACAILLSKHNVGKITALVLVRRFDPLVESSRYRNINAAD